ncbi:MAG: trypsin-like peptidase domain-containing protein [Clostridia bacterium]|nr:trypsin-like peptidase domain-containing protein [Clostridia bacterium]
MKCKNCGGPLIPTPDGFFKCKLCKKIDYDAAAPKAPASAPTAPAPAAAPAPRVSSGVDVFEKNIKGILELSCLSHRGASAGSGFLIDREGYAITNTHVVTDESLPCHTVVATISGERIGARIIALGDNQGGRGAGVDLALIKLDRVPYDASPIVIGDFDKVRIGEQVYVVGNSLGDGTCITSGIVSDKRRQLAGHTLMMTDCAINGGNSGGPIFNSEGIAIGVIVSSRIQRDGSATEGMNYAIPADIVLDFIRKAKGRL